MGNSKYLDGHPMCARRVYFFVYCDVDAIFQQKALSQNSDNKLD